MKKSQLRKLIRESIKELMNEGPQPSIANNFQGLPPRWKSFHNNNPQFPVGNYLAFIGCPDDEANNFHGPAVMAMFPNLNFPGAGIHNFIGCSLDATGMFPNDDDESCCHFGDTIDTSPGGTNTYSDGSVGGYSFGSAGQPTPYSSVREPRDRSNVRIRESIKQLMNEEKKDDPKAPDWCHWCFKQGCWCNRARGCVGFAGQGSCGTEPPVNTGYSPSQGPAIGVWGPNGEFISYIATQTTGKGR